MICLALLVPGLGATAADAATDPQVTLTNPVAASTVSGTVALAATATTDATQSDRPSLA